MLDPKDFIRAVVKNTGEVIDLYLPDADGATLKKRAQKRYGKVKKNKR